MFRAFCSTFVLAAAAIGQARLLVPQQYPNLASAVAAAQDGDTIEMAPGLHPAGGVRIDKSLTILATGARLFGSLGFSDEPLTLAIPAGKEFQLHGGSLGWFTALLVLVDHCQGRVTILDTPNSVAAIRIIDSPQVLLGRCAVTGGYTNNIELSPTWPALTATNSTVVLDRCTLVGARASYETSRTSNRAAIFDTSDVRCIDCVFRGGDASPSLGTPPEMPGAGAIRAAGGNVRITGAASVIAAGTFANEPALVMAIGRLVLEPGMNPTMILNGTTLVREVRPTVVATNMLAGQTANLQLIAATGSLGALLVGFPADRTVVPGLVGDVWLDPATACVAALGVPANGLQWSAAVPSIWALPVQFRWQGAVFDAGTVTFTDPGAALLY